MTKHIAMLLLLAGAGCASPIGVTRLGFERAYPQINANALTGPDLSDDTRALLRRHGALDVYATDPASALARLHDVAAANKERDILFALSEASYGAARRFERFTWVRGRDTMMPGQRAAREYDFAAVVYAYLFLFGTDAAADMYDPRVLVASHIYNIGLAHTLRARDSGRIDLGARVLPLPRGRVTIASSRPGFPWEENQFSEFIAADEYVIRGISSRVRSSGLGMPLMAVASETAFGKSWPPYYARQLKVPATAFLRVHGTLADMRGDELKATLELYCPFQVTAVKIHNQTVPLETDLTAHMAYNLEGAEVWHTELSQFLSGHQFIKTGVYLPRPYEPGKIPVVLVHGTSGSPGRWTELVNGLQADPVVRQQYQFWTFIYNSGQPIAYSAMLFRDSLESVVQQLDPEKKDPALRRTVVVGHSQGGLLARLSVVHSGDHLWRAASDKEFDTLNVSPETRSMLERAFFFEPSPYIQRVVFVSTPHRGSYRVNNAVNNLIAFLVKPPVEILRIGTDFVIRNPDASPRHLRDVPTSVAAMKPGSPFLGALAEMPFDPRVRRHSICAVLPGQDIATGTDGVVAYASAHLEEVESEIIVRDRHSCQGHPATIEEIRRILLLNLEPTPSSPRSP